MSSTLEFVNDPQFDGLPVVGAGHVLLARRAECGRAARWVPGGDVVALAEFLGESYPVLNGELYERNADRSLQLVDLSHPFFVVVPPGGQITMNPGPLLASQWAQVIEIHAKLGPAKVVVESVTPAPKVDRPVKAAAKKAAVPAAKAASKKG